MRKALILLLIVLSAGGPLVAFSANTDDLQRSIDAKNAEIRALEEEVTRYQNQVMQVQAQADTLQGTLSVIGKNQKKLQTNLTVTSKKAEQAKLTIEQNRQQIGELGQGIAKNTTALAETIRSLHANDNQSLVGLLASKQTVSEFMRDFDQIAMVQSRLKSEVSTMQVSRSRLESAQRTLADRKAQLETLRSQLSDQKKLVDSEAVEKKNLLAETKNKESEYQKLLADRKKQIASLNAEIFDYESKLKFTLDAKSLPGQGALSWPVSDVLITQKFGKTVDSKRLYTAGTHSGVDFRAAVGTPVYAAADGTVEGTGNTDTTCPKASFGKWVFIRHTNGLATAYGHLSLIKTSSGATVKAGDLIAYSGNTGHSTGPHLHLTVYAANGIDGQEGARVDSRPSASCKGRTFTMPVAPTNAYLDPMLYLPKATGSMFKDGGHSESE